MKNVQTCRQTHRKPGVGGDGNPDTMAQAIRLPETSAHLSHLAQAGGVAGLWEFSVAQQSQATVVWWEEASVASFCEQWSIVH